MKSPRFSIIIPTFNAEKTLQNCLESIEKQSYNSYQVVIVDGISTDNTLSIAKRFCDDNPSFTLTSEHDRGIYDAMNTGLKLATGEWLYFLGSDDTLFDQNVLEDISREINLIDSEVIYGNVLMTGESKWNLDGVIFNGAYDLPLLLDYNICHQAIFYKKSVFESLGIFNLDYPVSSDYDFNLRCFANTRMTHVAVTVANYYLGGFSSQYEDKAFHNKRGAILYQYFKWRIFSHSFLGSRMYLRQAALRKNSALRIEKRAICMLAYLKLKLQDSLNRLFFYE